MGERGGASRSQRFPLTCAVSAYVYNVPYSGTSVKYGSLRLLFLACFSFFPTINLHAIAGGTDSFGFMFPIHALTNSARDVESINVSNFHTVSVNLLTEQRQGVRQ